MLKKTSQEWSELCTVIILKPDGWNRENFLFAWFEEKITREEFEKRLAYSRITSIRPFLNNSFLQRNTIWLDK